jgi:YfiH family protein
MRVDLFRDPEQAWELPLFRAATLPTSFAHGFSARQGGTSAPPFDTLNLGGKWGDDAATVRENRRRFLRAAGVGEACFVARQVHGATVARVRPGDDPAAVARIEADALITDAPGVTLGVFVADCIPALIADPRTGAVAAVHAGWRGTVAGVLPAVVGALSRVFASRPADLRVALGPAIGPCCFEVGGEVVEAVRGVLGAEAGPVVLPSPRGAAGKWHVDLKATNRVLLERAGVDPEAIESGPECTHCDRARFFSYRRDGGVTGQSMGVIARKL